MYLVLTAMLALNVSADIINGYAAVDDSLHSTMKMISNDNQWYFDRLNEAMKDTSRLAKVQLSYDRSIMVREKSDSLFNFIQTMKDDMVRMADGEAKPNATVRQMNKKDDTNIPHQYGLNEGHGAKLKTLISEYNEFLAEMVDHDNSTNIIDGLNATFDVSDSKNADGANVSWEASLFHEMPVCASLTMLTKLQNDIRTSEHTVLDWLFDLMDASDLRVNKMSAYVIPKSDYVIAGGKYSARIIMAAIDSTKTPDYFVNGQQIKDGIYEVLANGVGEHKYKGFITYSNNGAVDTLSFESSYIVGEPTVTISNTEMNIMYRGFDNKFNISVPGVPNEKLKVDVQGASCSRQGGLWIIKPGDASKQVVVTVRAELDGKSQSMGSQTYRVKALPNPGAFFVAGGKSYSEGSVPKKQLTAADSYVEASYGEDGILDLPFQIVSFTLAAGNKLMESKSGKLTSEQINYIKGMRSGEMLSIMSVRAKGPDGKIKPLNAIPLTIR